MKMANIVAKAETNYKIEGFLFSDISMIDLMVLERMKTGQYIYTSRSFSMLGRNIKPILHCSLYMSEKEIELGIARIDIENMESFNKLIELTGRIRLTPLEGDLAVYQELKAKAHKQGIASLTSLLLANTLLNKVLAIANNRVRRALQRRLNSQRNKQELFYA